jgi:hypothetical protein
MATTPGTEPTPLPHVHDANRELRIYSHSALFYWWPVWAAGFIMAALTYLDGGRMAVVPRDAVLAQAESGKAVPVDGGPETTLDGKLVIFSPRNRPLTEPHLHMARNKNLGVLFATVLLLTIFITNVPLRGLWSMVMLLAIFLLAVIFALIDVWDRIFFYLYRLQIHVNAGGYFFISAILFIIWAVTVFIFDRRRYLAITSGQVRLCQAVGTEEKVYDTTGMTFSKKQDDLFRHWIVGLGSGDLIIHRSGQEKDIDLPNVLFVGGKIREIERLVKEREVV